MADIYVDSNAVGVADGTSWTDAYTTVAGAAGADSAGDTIWVASDHSENTAANVSWAWAGTIASPVRVISADKTSGSPPTTHTRGARIECGSDLTMNTTGTGVYFQGLDLVVGLASGTDDIRLNTQSGGLIVARDCEFTLQTGVASSSAIYPTTADARVRFIDCGFNAISTVAYLFKTSGFTNSFVEVDGGSLLSGHAAVGFISSAAGGTWTVRDFDASNGPAGFDILSGLSDITECYISNCKLPSSWTGDPLEVRTNLGRTIMYNCDDGDTNYKFWEATDAGDIKDETTLVRTDGASDGTTGISYNFTSLSGASWHQPLALYQPISVWNETTGSSVTVTLHILHDSATALQDDEFYATLSYLGTSGFPLAIQDTSEVATDGTAADLTTSSETWTTTGMTNPNEQQISFTFTPQEKGFIQIRPVLAKASYTVYVCPLVEVS